MPLLILIFAILTFLMIIYCKTFFESDNTKTFVIKIIACQMFLIIGIYSITQNERFDYTQTLVLIGLFLCVFGDILIGLRRIYPNKKNTFFLAGLTMFFFAHCIYGVSLALRYSDNYILAFVIIILLVTGFVILLEKTNIVFGKMRIPCYLYVCSSSVMLTISLITFIMTVNVGNLVMFIGILLFVISDSFLCYSYFKSKLQHPRLIKCISVVTYFTGQALIALSIFLY